ncbi:MAG: hypothetical protein IJZ24_05960 [Clostridia bacterium]|nr:hypothetical protein [Clostridia bacterium]
MPEEWERLERLISRPEKYSKKNNPDRPVGIIFCIKDALYSPKAKICTPARDEMQGRLAALDDIITPIRSLVK